MPPPFLILQHVGCEPAAAYEDALVARGFETVYVRPDRDEPLPDCRGYSGIIAMGGPMGAYEDRPWLDREKAYIADAVRASTPFWGVCLGAQLLAAALGSKVAPADSPEIGILPVTLSPEAADDPVFQHAPGRFMAFHWHSDAYEIPAGATHLASSAANWEQAFSIDRAYGLQFHLEVPMDLAEEWAAIPAYAESLETALGPRALAPLLSELRARVTEITSLAAVLIEAWVDNVVLPQASTVRTAG